MYCSDCFDDQFVSCDGCSARVCLDDSNDCLKVDKEHFCRECYNDIFTTCDECGVIIERDSAAETPDRTRGDGDSFCSDCWGDVCCECSSCGNTVWIDEAVQTQQAQGSRGARYECDECRTRNNGRYDYWDAARFNPSANTFDRVGSERCFGIELEYNRSPNAVADELDYFGRKGEHCGCEFYSSILSGDVGLGAAESLSDFADDNDWRINDNCGYHLHLDMRDENGTTMRSLAYAYRKTYKVWKSFVSNWRGDNCDYCHAPSYSADHIRNLRPSRFRDWAANSQRFLYVNWCALGDHTTVEIRLHSGTVDSKEVTDWVIAHTRFADWALSKTLDEIDAVIDGTVENDFQALSDIWGDDDLTAFYREQAASHDHTIAASTPTLVRAARAVGV